MSAKYSGNMGTFVQHMPTLHTVRFLLTETLNNLFNGVANSQMRKHLSYTTISVIIILVINVGVVGIFEKWKMNTIYIASLGTHLKYILII